MVAGLQPRRAQWIGDDADLLLVRAQRDHRALGSELLLENDDVTLHLVAGGLHDVEAVVQDELLTRPDVVRFDGRVQIDLGLPALEQDVDGAVVIAGEVDPVGGGRCREPVDLLLQPCHPLAGLVERVDELLILVEGLHELLAGVAQLVLEDHDLEVPLLDVTPADPVDGLHRLTPVGL